MSTPQSSPKKSMASIKRKLSTESLSYDDPSESVSHASPKRTRTLVISIPKVSDFTRDSQDIAEEQAAPSPTLSIFADLPPFEPELQRQVSESSTDGSDVDSLFDASDSPTVSAGVRNITEPADRIAPAIPGLFFNPSSPLLLPPELADDVFHRCMVTYFTHPNTNQVMLFERAGSGKGLPPFLTTLLSALSALLKPVLPPETHELLFQHVLDTKSGPQRRARQAIINLYHPGEGISPHVDLLDRFGDGIIGVSLGSGCVMEFAEAKSSHLGAGPEKSKGKNRAYGLYLPPRSVIVLSGPARYEWTHAIERRLEDFVTVEDLKHTEGEWVTRGTRLSVTFRWLLPGADIVGPEGNKDS